MKAVGERTRAHATGTTHKQTSNTVSIDAMSNEIRRVEQSSPSERIESVSFHNESSSPIVCSAVYCSALHDARELPTIDAIRRARR